MQLAGSTEQQNGRGGGVIEIRVQLILIHNYVKSWSLKFVLKLITRAARRFLAIYTLHTTYVYTYTQYSH